MVSRTISLTCNTISLIYKLIVAWIDNWLTKSFVHYTKLIIPMGQYYNYKINIMLRLIVLFLFLFSSYTMSSQLEFGLKAGLSSVDLADTELILANNAGNNVSLAVQEASYGLHFGIYGRLSLLGLYIEPAVLFNSSNVDYTLREQIFDTEVTETIVSEKYEKLNIPVMVGYKLGFLRLQAGPVAHVHLNNISELTDLGGYSEKARSATYGYQLGVGLDILKVRLDLNYEGNLSSYTDHITIDGYEHSFAENPARIVASIGYKF